MCQCPHPCQTSRYKGSQRANVASSNSTPSITSMGAKGDRRHYLIVEKQPLADKDRRFVRLRPPLRPHPQSPPRHSLQSTHEGVATPASSLGVFSPTPPLAAHPPNPASIPHGSTRQAVLLSSNSRRPNRAIHLSRQGSYELAHWTTASPTLCLPCAHEPDSVPHNTVRPSNVQRAGVESSLPKMPPQSCCRFNSNV